MTIIAKTPRWLPLAALALVLYAAVMLFVQWRGRGAPSSGDATGTAALDSAETEQLVSRALGQIPESPVDSTEIKTGWRDEVPGVDVAALTPEARELFVRVANSRMCTCGCGYTLAACRTFDVTCPVSGPRVDTLRDSVARGLVASVGLRTRPAPGRR